MDLVVHLVLFQMTWYFLFFFFISLLTMHQCKIIARYVQSSSVSEKPSINSRNRDYHRPIDLCARQDLPRVLLQVLASFSHVHLTCGTINLHNRARNCYFNVEWIHQNATFRILDILHCIIVQCVVQWKLQRFYLVRFMLLVRS